MATVIEEFVATLGWEVDTKELKKFEDQIGTIGKSVKWFAGLVTAATGAVSALTVITNQQTAVQTNLAKAVGISAENLEALSGAIANIGFDSEKVIDLVEEMNNKIGEKKGLGQFTAVEESLQILGLQFKDIKDLAPEEQFIKILDTAKELKDEQKAVSAVDMLMGGDANKILGWLRTQDESLQQIIQRRKELNVLTEEGRKGAVRFTETWNLFKDIIGSVIAQFSGLVGDAMLPIIDEMIEWIRLNKLFLQQNIKEWVESFMRVAKLLFKIIKDILFKINDLIDSLGGFDNVLKLVITTMGIFIAVKFVGAIVAVTKAVKAATLAQTLWNAAIAFWPALITAAIVLIGLIAHDIYKYFTDPEAITVTGKIVEAIKGIYDEAVLIVEEYIGWAIEQWAEWTGTSVELMNQLLIDIVDWVSNAITAVEEFFIRVGEGMARGVLGIYDLFETIWGFISNIVANIIIIFLGMFINIRAKISEMVALFLSIPDRVIAVFTLIGNAILNVFSLVKTGIMNFVDVIWTGIKKIVDFLFELPSKIVNAFSDVGSKIKGFLKGVPLIGSIFGEGEITAPPVPKNRADEIAGSIMPSSSIITNANKIAKTTSTKVENRFNITQLPGESGQDLSNRIVSVMEEKAAIATRNNDTGIEY